MRDKKDILKHVDHTLLKQDATWEQIKQTCEDAIKFNAASVCIPASYVKRVKEKYNNKIKICTVIGFPNGYSTTAAKVFETTDAVKNGADEIDMVINIGWVKDELYADILKEINEVKMTMASFCIKLLMCSC